MNHIVQLDYNLFALINGFAGRWWWLDAAARLFLNDYFVPTLLAIILLTLWFDEPQPNRETITRQAVLIGSLSAALANGLLKITNFFYYRPRPFEMLETNLLFYQPTDSSLPSNAAVLGFSIAAGVWIYRRRWGWLLLAIATLFGLSRIFGGVHYPLDVLAGAGLGGISALVIYKQKKVLNVGLTLIVTLTRKFRLP